MELRCAGADMGTKIEQHLQGRCQNVSGGQSNFRLSIRRPLRRTAMMPLRYRNGVGDGKLPLLCMYKGGERLGTRLKSCCSTRCCCCTH